MANRKRRQSGNPARAATAPRQPQRNQSQDSALRTWVADHSRRPIVILARQPKLLMPAIMVIFVLAGLAAPPAVAVVCLALLALFVGWLGFLSWPVLDARGRTMRALVIVVIVGVAIARVTGVLD